MTTETGKSPREIAEQIILHEYGVTWKGDNELIAAIEKALRDRDERAARIIREHRESDKCEGSCWEIITSAIRGKS
jgi:hypothetical protein